MISRKNIVALLVAICLLASDAVASRPTTTDRKLSTVPGQQELLAAGRWYQRARSGQLYRRSTPAGRDSSQTLRPTRTA